MELGANRNLVGILGVKINMLLTRSSVLAVLLGVLLLNACSSTPDEPQIADEPAAVLYDKAKKQLDNGNYLSAIEFLDALMSRYPFGPHADQVQLDLIQANYFASNYVDARTAADRFLRLNPTHKDIDYVLFMRGLIAEAEDTNPFQSLFGIDRSDRDPILIQEAFRDYERLLVEYPSSKYAADAAQRMISLKNRLARYEVIVAKYYYEREAYVSAITRGRYVMEHLFDTPSVEEALEYMAKSYGKLGLSEAKADTLAVLKLNFPDNAMVSEQPDESL